MTDSKAQYYVHSRRFAGGPDYVDSRNKMFEVSERELEAHDDYVYALNMYNMVINRPNILETNVSLGQSCNVDNSTTMSGLHNVPGNEAFRENYKRELDNSMKKWHVLAKEFDAAKMNDRKQVTHVTSAL